MRRVARGHRMNW